MKTQSAKAKGRRLQQKVAGMLLKHGDGLHEDDVISRSMGASGEDIMLSPAAREQYPVSIECKSRAKFAVYSDMDQAISNSKDHEPVLVIKANRREPLVVVDADFFFKLLRCKNA